MLATETKHNTVPTPKEVPFNYDLSEMEKVLAEKTTVTPKFKSFDDFDKWVDSL